MNINISTGSYRSNNYNNRYNMHRYRQGPRTVHTINKPWQRLLFNLVFLIVGIVLIIYGISSNINSNNKNFVETTATIIDYDYDHEGLAAIIVEYTVDNQKYQDMSDYRSSNPKSIGSSIEIKYNPDYPNEVIWSNGFTNVLIIIMGIVFTIFGAIGVFKSINSGLAEGFNSGTNTTIRYDRFGNIINDNINEPSRFDYSNQGQNINNPYATNNNYSNLNNSNQIVNNANDFMNNQNANNSYEVNSNYSDFNQNNNNF